MKWARSRAAARAASTAAKTMVSRGLVVEQRTDHQVTDEPIPPRKLLVNLRAKSPINCRVNPSTICEVSPP